MNEDRLPIVDLIAAELIYDYTPMRTPAIPHQLWPKGCKNLVDADAKVRAAGQFMGTHPEMLSEIAGRSCYDSFGKGRTSEGFHGHILEVKHGSVHEHFNFTVEVDTPCETDVLHVYLACMNRPNIWLEYRPSEECVRITLNMRHAIEWHFWSNICSAPTERAALDRQRLGASIREVANELAPNIIVLGNLDEMSMSFSVERVDPQNDEEKWITMLLTGSRGFSHELVRHGDRTAISQRSTRYVDENESPWVWHPLIHQYIDELPEGADYEQPRLEAHIQEVESSCKKLYGDIVSTLQPWLVEKLEAAGTIDPKYLKTSARKQARGAARGFLGNALYTEVVFSASVGQWNRILRQRAGGPADAEIRESFAEKVLPILQDSQYADSFEQWKLYDCEDGIGQAAREV